MSDRADTVRLLQVAESALLSELLPRLKGPDRGTASMVARAIAIARRETEAGSGPAARVLDAFAEFYGQDNVHRAGGDAAQRVEALTADLARELREGLHDDDLLGPVLTVLRTLVAERLRCSNPAFPETGEFSQPSRF